jgi:hypothetical protein
MPIHNGVIGSYGVAPIIYEYTSSGSGSVTVPTGYTKMTSHAIGAGGTGYASGGLKPNNRAGGGGGTYARSDVNIAVTPGNSVYYSAGASANDSWVNINGGFAPGSSTIGCLGKRGTNGASAVGGSGSTAGSVGSLIYYGDNGTAGSSAVGGGSGGDNGAGSGQTGGSGQNKTGGTGGNYNEVGGTPGGGGGGSSSGNKAGGVGWVKIIFTV